MVDPALAAPGGRLLLRPAAERFHSQLDWLDSWHSFSFAGHQDPAWMGFGPLRVINDDTIAAGAGFGMHPHRDMEILTVMVEGVLQHRDSLGHTQELLAGELQWMSAGTGVVHSEINAGSQSCRLLQIWIEPQCLGLTPSYAQQPMSLGPSWTLLLDPDGQAGAIAIHRPVRLWRACPRAGEVLPIPVASDRAGWLQMIEGALSAPLLLRRGDGLGFQSGGLSAPLQVGDEGADLLLFELA